MEVQKEKRQTHEKYSQGIESAIINACSSAEWIY